MNPADNLEKVIKQLRRTTTPETDERILEDAFAALRQRKQTVSEPSIWRILIKSRITKFAAAAVIIMAISFAVLHRGTTVQPDSSELTVAKSKSPAELTTLASLSFAYRQGGMERVEQICDKAIAMAGPRPAGISVHDLLGELNGKIQKGQSYEK